MLGHQRRLDYEGYLYILPAFLFLLVFVYYGMGFNVFSSLHDWNGLSKDKDFVGLANYINLLKDTVFIKSILNSLQYMVITVSVQMVIGLLVAVFISSPVWGGRFFRSLFFLPNVMSLVVIGVVFNGIYNYNVGSLNELLRSIGLGSLARDWMGDPQYALFSVMIANIFTYMGFSMTLYITGLLGIPNEVLEAAKIDGIGFFRLMVNIIVPLLKGVHTSLIILGIIGSLKTFDLVWMITQGGPARASEMVSTFLYRTYILEYRAGYSSAVSIMVMLIALVLTVVNMISVRKLAD